MAYPRMKIAALSFAHSKQRAVHYIFDKAGDEIPSHVHRAGDSHSTFVLRGAVVVYNIDKQRPVTAGQFVDLPIGVSHAIRSTVDDTEIINIHEPQVSQ